MVLNLKNNHDFIFNCDHIIIILQVMMLLMTRLMGFAMVLLILEIWLSLTMFQVF